MMTVKQALAKVASQHEALRARMDHCTELADEVEKQGSSPDKLAQELAELRGAFERHNRFEEDMLRPILRTIVETLRVDGIASAHVAEHRELDHRFSDSPLGELRTTIAMLRDHLAEEEAHFSLAANRAIRTGAK